VPASSPASISRAGISPDRPFFNPELNAKRLELLKEAVPEISRVAVLFNPSNPVARRVLQKMALTAVSLKLEIQQFEARQPDAAANRFSAMVPERIEAAVAIDDTILGNRRSVIDLAMAQRLSWSVTWKSRKLVISWPTG
jgi:putative tryptophan/tyrosine transport system substrate-binding protein